MKNTTRTAIIAALVCAGYLLAAIPSLGATFNLTAKAFDRALTLPDGTVVRDLDPTTGAIPALHMWGFKITGSVDEATAPGPELTVPFGDTTLTINLTNDLPVPVSIVIPNQNGYVRSGPAEHTALADAAGRMRAHSFVKEVLPGATGTYTWNGVTPGTYLYYSGSHAALQVQMGLYGMVKKNATANLAYPSIAGLPAVPTLPFAQEVVWFFSEIDLAVHDAIAAGPGPLGTYPTAITSMIHSVPDFFLLNGNPLNVGQLTAGLPGSGASPPTLIRMLNAGYDERIPIVNGYHLRIVAEDGRRFTYPKFENAVNLPSLKTRDVQLTAPRGTIVKYFDRRLLTMQ